MTDVLDDVVHDPFIAEELATSSDPAGAPPPRTDTARDRAPSLATAGDWFLAALLVGAGAIHLALAPAHLAENAWLGAGFLVSAWLQFGLAVFTVLRPGRTVRALALVVSAALFGAWWASRTVGLPFDLLNGEIEEIGLVDATCAVLEACAVIFAGFMLLRPRSNLLRATSLGVAAATLALVFATGAIASPSATGHDHGVVDDNGWSLLQNGQMAGGHVHAGQAASPDAVTGPPIRGATRGELAGQLAITASLVEKYPTLGQAKAAGYWQAGPFAPGLGVHFNPPGFALNPDGVMDAADIANPMLIFADITDDAPLAGFMYMAYTDSAPQGFAGPYDQWHFHTAVCIVYGPNGIDTPFGADGTGVTDKMCSDRGGNLVDNTGYMVHVWTVPGYESPEGTFSALNKKLTCTDGTYYQVPLSDLGDFKTTCRNAHQST